MIPVAFCLDEKLKMQLNTCIASLMFNRGKSHYHIYVVESFIDERYNKGLSRLVSNVDKGSKIEFITVENEFKNGASYKSITNGAYLRLMLPHLLDIDWVIYSDVDIIFQKSLEELTDYSMNNKWFAGVRDYINDPIYWSITSKLIPDLKRIPRGKHINSGFMIINLKDIRNNEQIYDIWKKEAKVIRQDLDQSLINIFCYEQLTFLPLRFNVLAGKENAISKRLINRLEYEKIWEKNEYYESLENPIVVHWAGIKKPWEKGAEKNQYFYKWWVYRMVGMILRI